MKYEREGMERKENEVAGGREVRDVTEVGRRERRGGELGGNRVS